ncbi:MAG: hypothetical protein HYR76_11960 [Ignavibacteria bacterium]|nr:hypothetical protein [Ignavibacteria bacterium]
MNFRREIGCLGIVSLFCIGVFPTILNAQRGRTNPFHEMIRDVSTHLPPSQSGIYVPPTDADFRDWNTILSLFRSNALDSCRHLLEKYHYTLTEVKDGFTGNTYDVFRERLPIQRGWGTFIFNRNHSKRLNIHVNHPSDDAYALNIGVECFRRSNAEWLFIGGTSKFSVVGKYSSDVGVSRRSIFQRWYENLSDLTHITVSLHTFSENSYADPISTTDVIVSNGKTSDDQWGVSQISLAFRDSARAAGFTSALAMFDSGYGRLAGGWNVQGLFSNDSLGFGHWLYIELSHRLLKQPHNHARLITAIDHATDLTGKRISQQVNRAFGLVSPRVVKVDSLHRIMFPPIGAETYRVISFDAQNQRDDTLDIRMGNWLELLGGQKSVASVTRLDTSDRLRQQLARNHQRGSRSVMAQLVTVEGNRLSSTVRYPKDSDQDSSRSGDEDDQANEPLQVHRIPLRPILASTFMIHPSEEMVSYSWSGTMPAHFVPGIKSFQMNASLRETEELEGIPKFLIPLINSSYRSGKSRFIGVEMTNILVNEIARLVTEHDVAGKDVGLLAEQSESGDYYLRIFPASNREKRLQDQPRP